MTCSDEFGIAVVGTGSIGYRHLVLLQKAGISPLYAIPIRQSRRTELEREGFSTLDGLRGLSDLEINAVIIATDTLRHPDDAIEALELGLHVLIEKPMAVDAICAKPIAEVASRVGLRADVGCPFRFSQSINTFSGLLGEIGRLHSVQIECRTHLPDWRSERPYQDYYSARLEEGGVLRDLIHEIDYAGWLFGWPDRIWADVCNIGRLGIEAEEMAELFWVGIDGCRVSISLDYLTRLPQRSIRAQGEHGTLVWDGIENTVRLYLPRQSDDIIRSDQTRNQRLLAQDLGFIEACNGDSTTGIATCKDGLRALAICDAARFSSNAGRQETVVYKQ